MQNLNMAYAKILRLLSLLNSLTCQEIKPRLHPTSQSSDRLTLTAFSIKKPKNSVSIIHLNVSEANQPTVAYLHIISALLVHTSAVQHKVSALQQMISVVCAMISVGRNPLWQRVSVFLYHVIIFPNIRANFKIKNTFKKQNEPQQFRITCQTTANEYCLKTYQIQILSKHYFCTV